MPVPPSLELYDAFTDTAFAGNRAGVVFGAEHLDTSGLQALATELGAPTTGFVTSRSSPSEARYGVRFFTPTREIDLCGHVTVAIATSLFRSRLDAVASHSLVLETTTGEVSVTVRTEAARLVVEAEHRFPRFDPPPVPRETVDAALGIPAVHPTLPFVVARGGLSHLLVAISDDDALSRLAPGFADLVSLGEQCRVETIGTYAPVNAGIVRMRDFCAPIGTYEETASGTTAAALTAWLASRSEPARDTDNRVRIRVEMGHELSRPSAIDVTVDLDNPTAPRVIVSGSAVRVFTGHFTITPVAR